MNNFASLVGRPADRFDDNELRREYISGMKYCFGHNVFCGNARKAQNAVAVELHARGITQIPNLFGPIEVSANW